MDFSIKVSPLVAVVQRKHVAIKKYRMDISYIRKLRQILRAFDRELYFQNTQACCNGVSFAQCHTLLELEGNKDITVSELAKNLSLDKSTTSRTVEGLVNIGLVNRCIPKNNRRMATLSLTEQGTKACDNINQLNDSYVSEALEGFTDEEKIQFLRLFEKLTNNMAKVHSVFDKEGNNRECC
jgi:DNA-binding MarR family transcriptional regulator